jgi:branched-chain amino acid transport system substrate-binding protein
VANRRAMVVLLALLALALAAAGCGGDEGRSAGDETSGSEAGDVPSLPEITPLTSAACTDIEYEGEGDPDVLIASDMVLQGSSRTQTLQIVEAIRQVLDSAGWKAGAVKVGFQSCDDSTAQLGKWDPGKCSQNANAYAENESLLAVIGTFNSGCAAVELPVLNQAPG